MAVITIITAGDMCGVLAGCNNTIMARATGANDLRVVDSEDRLKGHCTVAVFADICCLHVNRASTCGGHAIVTGDTISDDAQVVKYSRLPGNNAVAVVALVAG